MDFTLNQGQEEGHRRGEFAMTHLEPNHLMALRLGSCTILSEENPAFKPASGPHSVIFLSYVK